MSDASVLAAVGLLSMVTGLAVALVCATRENARLRRELAEMRAGCAATRGGPTWDELSEEDRAELRRFFR